MNLLREYIRGLLIEAGRQNRMRSVEDLVGSGYTEKQAEYIHRNISDMQDVKSPGVDHVLANPEKFPIVGGGQVEIFRVVPRGMKIEPGDFVFDSISAAENYRDRHGFKRGAPEIVSMRVSGEDLRISDVPNSSPDYGNEYIYLPEVA